MNKVSENLFERDKTLYYKMKEHEKNNVFEDNSFLNVFFALGCYSEWSDKVSFYSERDIFTKDELLLRESKNFEELIKKIEEHIRLKESFTWAEDTVGGSENMIMELMNGNLMVISGDYTTVEVRKPETEDKNIF